MPEGDKPLEQRPKGGRGRSSSPRVIVRRNIFDNTTTLYVPSEAPRPLAATEAPPALPPTTTTDLTATTSSDSEDDDEAPRTITTTVSVHTRGGELAKRPRPSTSSSGCSDEQEDKRVKLTRPALPGPIEHTEPPRSPTPPRQGVYRDIVIPTIPTSPPLPPRSPPPPPRRSPPPPPTEAPPLHHQEEPAPVVAPHEDDPTPSCSHSAQLDSTSYAGLASPAQLDVPMRPVSPQPGPSYAAAAAAPASPRRAPQPTSAPVPSAPVQPTPRSTYPPLVVERLPNWTRHFAALGGILGHPPNARPLGAGVRFLPQSAEEFRAVQRYLTAAAVHDSTISWYCYSPASEIPTKIAIRGLMLDTPVEEVVAALCARGFPAESARAIPPPRGKHGCTYFVRLAHLGKEELGRLYATTELLLMPNVTVEAWRGGQKPPQCFRCQQFSHSSANCHRPMRCVRCAGEHAVRDCPRSREEDPKCANCGLAHAANDRRCALYKREARRRGIAQPPPPPRAPANNNRHQFQQRATAAPAPINIPPANRTSSTVKPSGTTAAAPATAAQGAAAPAAAAQAAAAPAATVHAAAAPVAPAASAAAPITSTATRPTTLVAEANPPTERGRAVRGRKRKGNRAPRPVRSEPAAASTPQPQSRQAATTAPAPAPRETRSTATTTPSQAPPRAPPAPQPAQGEARTNPDVMAIVRVVVEALMTGLTAYLQGQGVIPALAAGMAALTRLHSC